MNYQLIGTITEIGDTIQITDTLKKRNFVVRFCVSEFSNKYEEIEIETYQENCSLLDNYKENDGVKIHFSLRCKKWESPEDHTIRYFPHLVGWKIEKHKEEENSYSENESLLSQNKKEEDLDNFIF